VRDLAVWNRQIPRKSEQGPERAQTAEAPFGAWGSEPAGEVPRPETAQMCELGRRSCPLAYEISERTEMLAQGRRFSAEERTKRRLVGVLLLLHPRPGGPSRPLTDGHWQNHRLGPKCPVQLGVNPDPPSPAKPTGVGSRAYERAPATRRSCRQSPARRHGARAARAESSVAW
jgi:hypothetical protein